LEVNKDINLIQPLPIISQSTPISPKTVSNSSLGLVAHQADYKQHNSKLQGLSIEHLHTLDRCVDSLVLSKECSQQRGKNQNTKNTCSSIALTVSQWNGRSINNDSKINFVRTLPGEIIALQEIWQREEEVGKIDYPLTIQTRSDKRGGGTAIIGRCDKTCVVSNFPLNKDSCATKLRVKNHYMWLVNVYINDGSIHKLTKILGKIRTNIPSNEWRALMLIGDFNINASIDNPDFQLLISASKSMGLNIWLTEENTTEISRLDYVVAGSLLTKEKYVTINSLSDHKAIAWDFKLSPISRPKSIFIPDRQLAADSTISAIKNTKIKDAQDFLVSMRELRTYENVIREISGKWKRDMNLLDKLISIDDSRKTKEVVDEYWNVQWKNTENVRFSEQSKLAYSELKRILKYNLFEKRDGGIINRLLDDNGTLITETDEVNNSLAKTIKEIQIEDKWGWIAKKNFPKLPRLNEKEMETIVNLISTGKAVAYDAISDDLFLEERDKQGKLTKSCPKSNTIIKLRNLWRIELDTFLSDQDTWGTRLVPLNKVFPNNPTRTQLRPIMVQSALIKLLESRFLPKLRIYMLEKLHRSQTGFVSGMDIHVNLNRALDRICWRTHNSRPCFGLFIDFSNAFNSVPQTLLFHKLRAKNIFEEEEIVYLEQLYNRYRIRIGDIIFSTNKGVAQGSLISPSLFNIFIEDLAVELQEMADLNLEDILLYADDVLTLCSSVAQLEKAIKIIENWSAKNGMTLNKKKSGVVVFAPREAKDVPFMALTNKSQNDIGKNKQWIPATKSILDIPLCTEYKYLGTWLDSKLTIKPQIRHIKKKSNFLFIKLYPFLSKASADGRRDMFMTMVSPLFTAAHILLKYEPSLSQRHNLETLWRVTFKCFLMISQRTNSLLVNEMIGKNLSDIADETFSSSQIKWEARKSYQTPKWERDSRCINKLRAVPNSWCRLINTMSRPCPKCKKNRIICNRWHLKYAHCITLPHINKIWREEIIPQATARDKDKPKKRHLIREKLEIIIAKHLSDFETNYEALAAKS